MGQQCYAHAKRQEIVCSITTSPVLFFFGVYASLVMIAARPHRLLDVGENATKNGTLRRTHLLLY
jgi:hypothetical protein